MSVEKAALDAAIEYGKLLQDQMDDLRGTFNDLREENRELRKKFREISSAVNGPTAPAEEPPMCSSDSRPMECGGEPRVLDGFENLVDKIAARCGWLPLTVGEKMTVHFDDKEYVITRNS